jgi:hypothetical protein
MTDLESLTIALDALKFLVAPHCQETLAVGQHQITLKEDKAAAKGRLDKVHFDQISGPIALFLPDKAKQPLFSFLAEGKPQKAVDAIVAMSFEGRNYLIACEMKSGSISGAGAQLRNTDCLLDFMVKAARHHHQVDLSQWERRFVVLCSRRIPKSRTRMDRRPVGISPDRPLEIRMQNNQRLPIRALCP